MTVARESADVAIVGFGPVGEVLAGLLGMLGVDVIVVEREPGVYHLPRAAHLDAEIMRVLQTLGASGDLAEAVTPVRGMHFVTGTGQTLLRFDTPEGVGPQAWRTGYMFYQPELELALRRVVARHPSVRVRLSCSVEAVHPEGDRVRLETLDAGGRRSELEARWVVGCDGARSTIRQAMGATLGDLGLHQPWLVLDAVVDPRAALPDRVLQVCDPRRPTTYVPMPGQRRRWEFMVLEGEDPDAMPGRCDELLAPWIDPRSIRVERATTYTFHALMADRWREGRLLLAGDAAHQMPPFLGQGACSGIRDAANLAWKLARVLAGAPEGLLDTYQSERAPHVRRIIDAAVFLGGILQTTDDAVAAARDAAFARGEIPRLEPLDGTLGEGLHGDAPPPAGTLSAQPYSARDDGEVGDRLDDLVGYRFALVGDTSATPDSTLVAWQALGALHTAGHLQDATRRWLEGIGATAAVVRPDRYLLWAGGGRLPDPPPLLGGGRGFTNGYDL